MNPGPAAQPPALPTPNFFLAGVSRAGTTSLHAYLGQHPQVFMSPVKEPTFFGASDLLAEPHRADVLAATTRNRASLVAYLDGPQPPVNFRLILDWNDYLQLFRDSRGERVRGESSTAYFWLPSAARAISGRLPDARVALMLRDPTERLFTLYLQHLWSGSRPAFPTWFKSTMETPRIEASTVGAGRYATHLQRFMQAFPRDRLRIYLYDDYRADPRSILRDLFSFVGVDPDHQLSLSERRRESVVPRFPRLHVLRRKLLGDVAPTAWLPPALRRAVSRVYQTRPTRRVMDAADRRMVIDYYRREILETAELIGRDLSGWLR